MPGSKQWAWFFSFSGRMPTEHLLGPERKMPRLTAQTPCCWQKRTQPPTNTSTCAVRGQGSQVAVPRLPQRAKQMRGLGTVPAAPPPPDPAILELFKKLCFPLWGQDQDAASRLDSQKCNQVRQVPSDPRASPAPSLAPLPFTEHSLAFSNAT